MISISAIPDEGYRFVEWKVDGKGTFTDATSASTWFRVLAGNANVTAVFEPIVAAQPTLPDGALVVKRNSSTAASSATPTLNQIIYPGAGRKLDGKIAKSGVPATPTPTPTATPTKTK
jgi:hypothetical protein